MPDETKSDLPATIDETSNAALDTVTELALDAAIPAPIRRNVLKALDRLGSALIDIPIGALERRSSEKRAESEARIKITEAVNAQIIQLIKVDPEFPQRASNTFAKKILREQYNLEKILGFATDILRGKQDNNPEDVPADNESEKIIDDDWFNIFEKEGSQKSTEETQRRFARILAGEIEKPGSYSIRTLKTLGELDQNAATLFKSFCSACIIFGVFGTPDSEHVFDARVSSLGGNAGSNALSKYGLSYRQLNILNEYGLIISDYNSWYDCNSSIAGEQSFVTLPFQYQEKYWILLSSPEKEKSEEFRLSGVALSRVGRELFRIVDQDPMQEYTEDLKKFFMGQKLQMVEVPSSESIILKGRM